jgi:AbrB family looped-hinge helix DNA binding protein
MTAETVVTRGSQITLTKEVREKLRISEGDRVVLNVEGGILVVSKRDAKVFDDIGDFLPDNFEKNLKAIRRDSTERFKRLGII